MPFYKRILAGRVGKNNWKDCKDKKLKLNLPPSLQYIQGKNFKNILQIFREINSLFFLQVKMDNL